MSMSFGPIFELGKQCLPNWTNYTKYFTPLVDDLLVEKHFQITPISHLVNISIDIFHQALTYEIETYRLYLTSMNSSIQRYFYDPI